MTKICQQQKIEEGMKSGQTSVCPYKINHGSKRDITSFYPLKQKDMKVSPIFSVVAKNKQEKKG